MPLLNDLHQVLVRLAPRGWAALFQQHGGALDISVPLAQLAAELQRPLNIDRLHPGFVELSASAIRGVEAGSPARSLLYHALASPDVHPLTVAAPVDDDYPTLEELDVVENYVFGLAPRKLSSFRNPVVAVFACQYRTRPHSPHGQHADLAFSRTGLARIGTEAERYRGAGRSFDPSPASVGGRGFATQPARYVAYIAEYGPPSAAHAIYRPAVGLDQTLTFAMPAHKLFAGDECLLAEDGSALSLPALKFAELHRNEKLARIHFAASDNPGRIAPLPGFDLSAPPFVRTSKTSRDLVRTTVAGDSLLVAPVPNALVRTATQNVAGKKTPVRFLVPPAQKNNRFWSSLQIRATNSGRAAPEYANMRLEYTRANATAPWRSRNLNDLPDPPPAGQLSFEQKLDAGGYETAHFVDSTCEGAITLQPLAGLALNAILPAFSLVAAVDYFPQVEQATVTAWLERKQNRPIGLSNPGLVFPQGGPQPLSDGRFDATDSGKLIATGAVPDSELPHPLDAGRTAFDPNEAANQTATAIIGFAAAGVAAGSAPLDANVSSWLPDAAADYFAPGWDVSEHVVDGRPNYVAYGLGSPFPEDSKLCAALNSFWPAVAPDSSRTYGFGPGAGRPLHTSIPLLDSELGYHAQHPRVAAGEVAASSGWDGDQGPFLETRSGQLVVNASNPMRADETQSALAGEIGYSGLERIDSDTFIRRIEELLFCRSTVLPMVPIPLAEVWLVSVEAVDDWTVWNSTVLPRANAALKDNGFIFVFAVASAASATNAGNPPTRLAYNVEHTVQVQLSQKRVFWKLDQGSFKSITR